MVLLHKSGSHIQMCLLWIDSRRQCGWSSRSRRRSCPLLSSYPRWVGFSNMNDNGAVLLSPTFSRKQPRKLLYARREVQTQVEHQSRTDLQSKNKNCRQSSRTGQKLSSVSRGVRGVTGGGETVDGGTGGRTL